MKHNYDLIIVGGGIAGAALAYAMAKAGASALVIEREGRFKDRVRGEAMSPWGVAEARALGIEKLMLDACGKEIATWSMRSNGVSRSRDLPSTTPQRAPTMSFYHPAMQEALLRAAAEAGAEIRRGAVARGVLPGAEPGVAIDSGDGGTLELRGRIVVGADGRTSAVRRWAGFEVKSDSPRLRIAGVLLDAIKAPADAVSLVTSVGRAAILVPLPGDQFRVYFAYHRDVFEGMLSGEADLPRFIEESTTAGAPAAWYEGARIAGPLATFEGADTWVDAPYREGIALIGDAAASSDPTWGQGLSLTLRDARALRDSLLATSDWGVAGHAYAAEHDRYYETLHTYEDWITELIMVPGPAADARRARAFTAAMTDPTRMPDIFHSGPDVTLDAEAHRRFLGE